MNSLPTGQQTAESSPKSNRNSAACENPYALPQTGEAARAAPNSSAAARPWFHAAWAIVAAFGAYFCMYAFRKPFTAATADDFGGLSVAGIDYKTLLVTVQVLGYMLSKFIGIKVVAEMPPQRRAIGVLALIGAAELSLVLLGVIPAPWNFPLLFLNGLMLGMVFGLVMGFLEGRCLSEALIAGLCASFILADGVMKSVGTILLTNGVSPFWMPAAAGLLFAPLVLLFVWMLSRIPPPTPQDIAERSARPAMTSAERWSFLQRYGLGLGLVVAVYVLTTVLRSVRADFAPEIWKSLGHADKPGVFTQSEIWVALGVVLINGLSFLIVSNRRAFFASLGVSAIGFVLVLVTWGLHWRGAIDGFWLMVLIGLGLYLPYVAVHTTVFERLIAMTRQRGNVGFLMYVADASGYAAYVVVMLVKNLQGAKGGVAASFPSLCLIVAGLSLVALGGCTWYFHRQTQADRSPRSEAE